MTTNIESKRPLEPVLWIVVLCLLVFFGRWGVQGLSIDAALHSGLAFKALATGEFWKLSGTYNFFPRFFDHPPFFFQWGAGLLSLFGHNDGAARASGAVFGTLSVLVAAGWSWHRLGRATSFAFVGMILTFSHFTKVAATAMTDAPLSFGVALAAIGTFEMLRPWATGPRWLGAAFVLSGAAIAVAAKGLAGFGVVGAVGLAFWVASPGHWKQKLPGAVAMGAAALFAAFLPLMVWAGNVGWEEGTYFYDYWNDQVFGSFSRGRADSEMNQVVHPFYYLGILFKYGWPWWWTVPAGWLAVYFGRMDSKHPIWSRFSDSGPALLWAKVSFVFSICFVIPFSFSKVQYPHYIHPTYVPTLLMGAWFLAKASKGVFEGATWKKWLAPGLRWALVCVAIGVVVSQYSRGWTSPGRGQPFAELAANLESVSTDCSVLIKTKDSVSLYAVEAYMLWYLPEFEWREENGPLTGRSGQDPFVWWSPTKGVLLATESCRGNPR